MLVSLVLNDISPTDHPTRLRPSIQYRKLFSVFLSFSSFVVLRHVADTGSPSICFAQVPKRQAPFSASPKQSLRIFVIYGTTYTMSLLFTQSTRSLILDLLSQLSCISAELLIGGFIPPKY